MRSVIFSMLVIVIWMGLQLPVFSQVEFIEVTSMEEMLAARQKASEKKLPLFVDVYATWCGPCKMMDRDVYPNPEVEKYMNENFVSVRMDGEIEYGTKFASENGLQGYPSMFLFDPDGSHMSTIVGFLAAEELLVKLKGIVDNNKVIGQMNRDYEAGELENGKYPEYIATLRGMGQEEKAEKIALKYMVELDAEAELSDSDMRVVAFYLTMDHELWPSVSNDIPAMKELFGEEYMLVIESVFNRTLMKGIEEENIEIIDLLSESIDKYVKGTEAEAESLEHLPYLQYFYYSGKNSELIEYVDATYNKSYKGDHEWLFESASQVVDMDQQYITPEIQEKGIEWFQTCIDLEARYDYYFYKGMCLYFTKKVSEAEESFKTAGALAEDEEQKQMVGQVMEFIKSNKAN